MSKQTAVEWLIDKHFGGINNVTPDFKYHIKQAKEMEREQIMDAFNDGNWVGRCAIVDDNLSDKTVEKSAQTYYNETFNP
jgi:hypothetical protein